jgi:osmotically-inducible protein OsmY
MAAVTALSGCVPLVVGGAAVGGTVVATDRRSSATVLNDEGIELRAGRQIYDAVGGSSHISVTSWNGRLLLTGEVPTEQDRQRAEQVARGVENVREVINDLAVMPSSGLGTRTNDSFITSKVKSALAGAANVSARNVKVITERGSTYLMGSVTREEAEAATEAARTVSGVQRVVRVFDYVDASQADANVVPAQASYPRTTPTPLGNEGSASRAPVSNLGSPPPPAAPRSQPIVSQPVTNAPVPSPAPAPAAGSQVQPLPPLEPAQSSPVTNSPLR